MIGLFWFAVISGDGEYCPGQGGRLLSVDREVVVERGILIRQVKKLGILFSSLDDLNS